MKIITKIYDFLCEWGEAIYEFRKNAQHKYY